MIFFRLLVDAIQRLSRQRGGTTLKVLVAVAVIVWFSASGYLYFEIQAKPNLTWGDSFWWSIVTMTTVGYGDHFPETPLGRYLIGVPTMLFGISVLGYLLSSVAAYLIEDTNKELKGMKQVRFDNHVLIIHYNDLNHMVQLVSDLHADESTKNKPIVLIDDRLEILPPELVELGVKYVRGNPTHKSTFEQANYSAATHAIVLARDPTDSRSDDLTLAVTMTIEHLNADIETAIECVDPNNVELLRRTGCDSVVCTSKLSSNLLIQELIDPGVQAVFAELSAVQIGQQIFVVPIESMPASAWPFGGLSEWCQERRLMALGVKRGDSIHLNPGADFSVEAGDAAVVVGKERPVAIDAA
ncbi:MAG: potassium channel family protein [Haliangiales bacterium]